MSGEEQLDFNLNDYLKLYLDNSNTVPCETAHPTLLECDGDAESLSIPEIDAILDPIIDAIANSPEAITQTAIFETMICFLKLFPTLSQKTVGKIFDMIVSGLSQAGDAAHQDIETDEQETFEIHKMVLAMYGFLLQWAITAAEGVSASTEKAAPAAKGKGRGKAKGATAKKMSWDPEAQIKQALDAMSKVLRIKLQRLFVTTAERDTMISLFTRPSYLVLENESRVKLTEVRKRVFKVLCLAVKHHGHAFGAQTTVVQNLSYYEHLAEPMAEFLHILCENFDYPQLTDEILKELCNKEFNNNDAKGPKSVSAFITKLSELSPRVVGKQMILLVKLLDSEAYALRQSIVDLCGNMILDLSKEDERSADHQKQLDSYFDILEERFMDLSPYVRMKAIQTLIKLFDNPGMFQLRRQRFAELATRSLEDRSSGVRKNAVRLLTTLVKTHPYKLHGGLLCLSDWTKQLSKIDEEIDQLAPPEIAEVTNLGEQTVNTAMLDEPTQMEVDSEKDEEADEMDVDEEDETEKSEKDGEDKAKDSQQPQPDSLPSSESSELLEKLKVVRKYHTDGIRFIETLHEASGLVVQLLSSKTKAEVIEAMDFFCTIDTFKVETARDGTRKMLRLIWTKGTNDEGKGIQMHLIECYKALFFEAPPEFNKQDTAMYIARNMVSLTFGTSPAELTSLEQLLSTMMKEGMVDEIVINKLWGIYAIQKKEISRTQRRGAIMVLGMLSLADPEIVVREIDTIVRVGLGQHGKADLGLAKYSCVALRSINPVASKTKESTTSFTKLPNDHIILTKLAGLIDIQTDHMEWYGMAEQALGAIYTLAKHPDVICGNIIKKKTKEVFLTGGPTPDGDEEMQDADAPPKKKLSASTMLSQLLFIVGHVAIKQIVFLELIEMEFKRRKAVNDKAKQSQQKEGEKDAEQDELDLIGGTTEDDFTEAMQHIRERELLYGEKSLLSSFGPLVTEICKNNMLYNDKNLQSQATLCLAKLMCVSSEYCEQNLPLLITIMEKSPDAITRSNVVIALGDMAVCFNHLIDENTDFLYRRLNDPDTSVRRTCLMTLTFLILAGQVKVKGQLGEMAKCIEDSDKRIADLSRMFFTELATKDNAVYNHFVDMFSLLTAENMEEDSFKRIIKFLSSFIEKDKHAKQLSDKLAARLNRCETQRQWDDVAFALSLLQHKNEDIKKTIDAGFRLVQSAA